MSVTSVTSANKSNSVSRPIVIGGMFIFIIEIIHQLVVVTLIQKTPFILVWQYIASGVLGEAAFAGGMATALLGVFFHLIISLAVAAVFILAADRIPFVCRNLSAAALLYGFGVFIVMNMIVIPLSAAPQVPMPALPWIIESIVEHVVLIGLPLGIVARRSANGTILQTQ